MTNHQELSEKLAGLLGIRAYRYIVTGFTGEDGLTPSLTETWLTQDEARMFDLMVEHRIDVFHEYDCCYAYHETDVLDANYNVVKEDYKDFPNKSEATCIAIAKAIIAKEEK